MDYVTVSLPSFDLQYAILMSSFILATVAACCVGQSIPNVGKMKLKILIPSLVAVIGLGATFIVTLVGLLGIPAAEAPKIKQYINSNYDLTITDSQAKKLVFHQTITINGVDYKLKEYTDNSNEFVLASTSLLIPQEKDK